MEQGTVMGGVEVITGCMFSGKTEELIRRLRRAVIAKQRVQVFKPAIDVRYHEQNLAAHSGTSLEAECVTNIAELLTKIGFGVQVVGIDEAQFFGPDLVGAVEGMADAGVRVIIAGLDTDWRGQPFEPMPKLLAIAEQVLKCTAICTVCGMPASRSQKVEGSNALVEVGAADRYEARCRKHHRPEVGGAG